MEGLIQHFELIMPNRGVETPRDEIYAAVESPNGELGYYLVCDGSQTAWRVRTRPAVVHPFFRLSQDHQGLHARRRRGRPGKLEHHRRRARPLTENYSCDRSVRQEMTAMPLEPVSVTNKPGRIPISARTAQGEDPRRCFRAIRASVPSRCRPCTWCKSTCAACRCQAMAEIAELLEITAAEVHDTMSFYGFFPAGADR